MRSGTTEVAVKMVTRPVDGTALRVVQQGIADLQQIRRHANVVQFYGACLTDTAIMLCIEYMEVGPCEALRMQSLNPKTSTAECFQWHGCALRSAS